MVYRRNALDRERKNHIFENEQTLFANFSKIRWRVVKYYANNMARNDNAIINIFFFFLLNRRGRFDEINNTVYITSTTVKGIGFRQIRLIGPSLFSP